MSEEELPKAMAAAAPSATPSTAENVEAAPSNVSVNTFVAVQVQDIMEKAALNMACMRGEAARAAGDSADAARVKALRHQVGYVERNSLLRSLQFERMHFLHLVLHPGPT